MTADTRPATSPYAGIGMLFLAWGLLALAFALTSTLVPGMDVSGGFWSYVWVSALFGFVNAIIGTLLRIITFPLVVLTFGLFAVIVNALLLSITDALSSRLTIDEFWWTAIWAAIVLGLVTLALQFVMQELFERDRRDGRPD
jgi:putative membrane protein